MPPPNKKKNAANKKSTSANTKTNKLKKPRAGKTSGSVVDQTLRRILRILAASMKEPEGVTLEDVRHFYVQDGITGIKEHFEFDCRDLVAIRCALFGPAPMEDKLTANYRRKRPLLLQLSNLLRSAEHFLPELHFENDRLKVSDKDASQFMRRLRENREPFAKLAEHVLQNELLAAAGTLFLGFGCTVHASFLRLLDQSVPGDIATTSVEVVAALHRLARHGKEARLYLATGLADGGIAYGEVDWNEGTIHPTQKTVKINTVLLSFERLGSESTLVTSKGSLGGIVERAIEQAAKVIIIADKKKLSIGTGSGVIELPAVKNNGAGFLVTDGPLPKEWRRPEWLTHVVAGS